MKRAILLSAVCLLLTMKCVAQGCWHSLDDVNAPMQERLQNKDYKVSLLRDGEWQDVKVYGALTSDYNHFNNHRDFVGVMRKVMGFVMFTDEFRKPVKVRVTRQGTPFSEVEIRPLSYRIKPRRVDANTVEFMLRSPSQKVSVEFDGDRASNIFIIPDLPCECPADDNLLFFLFFICTS